MALRDIPLGWVLLGVALLAGAFATVVLTTRNKSERTDEQTDSWELSEQRRRRKERVYASLSYLLLFCCAAVAAALSFHGLVGFGRENLNLSGGWEYLVPFGLDGAAMFSAVLAVREASNGDASLGSRLLVWLFAGASAWFNWVHAPRGGLHAGAPQFFAGMSLSAAILFDRALKQTRKAALREQGLVPRPLPQIRVVRWLRAPRETYRAWSLMLLEGVRSLDEAVDEVREEQRRQEEERTRRKEQGRLERARLKALSGGRHRRMLTRGTGMAGDEQVELEVEGAAGPPAPAGELDAARTRPALEPAADEARKSGLRSARSTRQAAERDVDDYSTTTSPRLDSLEEKLAQIERAFG
jgi:hypothetical protein